MNKKLLLTIGGGIVVLALAGAAIFTALRLQQTTDVTVAPNVPQSQPRAQTSDPDNAPLELTFNVTGGTAAPGTATPTPTPTPTAAPAGGGATATPTAAPATGGTAATAAPSATTAPTAAAETLPVSGMSLPTILGVSGGVLLLVAGLVLAL